MFTAPLTEKITLAAKLLSAGSKQQWPSAVNVMVHILGVFPIISDSLYVFYSSWEFMCSHSELYFINLEGQGGITER